MGHQVEIHFSDNRVNQDLTLRVFALALPYYQKMCGHPAFPKTLKRQLAAIEPSKDYSLLANGR